jgi:glyoxylase-like metal-dependent hydrolase (beta-lactamase superfamily II)
MRKEDNALKKTLKISLIVVAGIVVVVFLAMFLYMMNFMKETKAMTPLETQEISEGIYVLQNKYVNVYILDARDQHIAIDAGANAKRVMAEMETLQLDPNEVKKIGDTEIECIPTPGHTPGSVSYLVNGKYLFVGDNMRIQSGSVELFNETFNMDPDTQAQSLKRLAQLEGVEYVFSAHYGMTSDFDAAMDSWK